MANAGQTVNFFTTLSTATTITDCVGNNSVYVPANTVTLIPWETNTFVQGDTFALVYCVPNINLNPSGPYKSGDTLRGDTYYDYTVTDYGSYSKFEMTGPIRPLPWGFGSGVVRTFGSRFWGINSGDDVSFSATSVDGPPVLISSSPLDNAQNISLTSNITLTFDENIQVGTGYIRLFKVDGTSIQAFDVTSDASISGSTITLNPIADLASLTSYYIQIDATAIKDLSNNFFSGITDTSTLNFSTIDTTAPTVALAATSSTFSGPFTVTATFSEAVTGFVVGDITVSNGTASNFAATSTSVYTFDVTPVADGTVTVDVAGSVAIDASSNNNTAATQLSVTFDSSAPTVVLTGPSGPVTAAFTVTATFSETVTGLLQSEVTVPASEGTVTGLSGSGAVYTITVDPILGQTVNVSIAANAAQDGTGNGNLVSNTFTIQAASPASEFEANKSKILSVIASEAMRGLGTTISNNVQITNAARVRLKDTYFERWGSGIFSKTCLGDWNPQRWSGCTATAKWEDGSTYVGMYKNGKKTGPSVYTWPNGDKYIGEFKEGAIVGRGVFIWNDGTKYVGDLTPSTSMLQGTVIKTDGATKMVSHPDKIFYQFAKLQLSDETQLASATKKETTNGSFVSYLDTDFDFKIVRDGSVTANFSIKQVWEKMASENMSLGYFLGAEVGRSILKGEFAGDQNGFGVSAGGYFVYALKPNLYLDGFASLGIQRKYLDIDNGTLGVTSIYEPVTSTIGGSLTGVVPMGSYEISPQVQLTHGRTNIGTMPITATAYGLTDSTLSMDAGSVSQSSMMFSSQIKIPLDAVDVSQSRSMLTITPRVTCSRTEMTTITKDCGGGAEFGYSSTSEDGLRNTDAIISIDRMGTTTTTGLELNLELRF